jgi:hypothetical protein
MPLRALTTANAELTALVAPAGCERAVAAAPDPRPLPMEPARLDREAPRARCADALAPDRRPRRCEVSSPPNLVQAALHRA